MASSMPVNCVYTAGQCDGFVSQQFLDTVTANLVVDTVYHPTTVPVTVTEAGLPAGALWSASISGNEFTQPNGSFTAAAPANTPFLVDPSSPIDAGGHEFVPTTGGQYNFSASSNVTIRYVRVPLLAFDLNVVPSIDPYLNLAISDQAWGFGYYSEAEINYGGLVTVSYGCPMPWYFPYGFVLNVTNSDEVDSNLSYASAADPTLWAGSGAGNFTGSATAYSVLMDGPINETMWTLPFGQYAVNVVAPGLPPTSELSFDWDGAAETAALGSGSMTLPNVPTGVHKISDIRANSSQPGWTYVGTAPDAGSVVVPQQTTVNVSLAYVDVGSPVGQVSFHAANLTNGTRWQVDLNGSTYSSVTPWINATTHSGTYSFSAGPATSPTGSIGYVATGIGAEISVTTGATILVNYSAAYKVTIVASAGGSVSPSGVNWYLPGQSTPALSATPDPGDSFVGWSGSGIGSYTGSAVSPVLTADGPIVETASFAPLPLDRFDLNFTQTGVPTGVPWQVNLGGTPYTSTGAQLVIPNLDGVPSQYAFTVPYAYGNNATNATRYIPSPGSGTVVAGTNFENALTFQTQHFLTLESTANGTATSQVDNLLGSSTWFPAGTGVVLGATADPGYTFAGWVGTGAGSYTGPSVQPTISPSGSISELATFVPDQVPPTPTYDVMFQLATTVVPETVWMVTIGGTTFSSTGIELNATGLAAGPVTAEVPGAYSPDGLSQYSPLHSPLTIQVSAHTAPAGVAFATAYWLYVATVGPGTVSTNSRWVDASQAFSIQAAPEDGASLESWTGEGPGAYTGTGVFANVTANGSISEVATFADLPSLPATSPTSGLAFLTSDAGVAVLALVGLLVGVLLALLVVRGGARRPPAGDNEEAPAEETGPSTGDGEAAAPPPASLPSVTLAVGAGRRSHRSIDTRAAMGVALVAMLLVSSFTGIAFGGASTSAYSPGSQLKLQSSVTGHAPPSPPPSSGPGTFWENDMVPPALNNSVCLGVDTRSVPYQSLCGRTAITNEPSLNLSDNGVLVTAYTAYTNETPCATEYPVLLNYTYTQVGIATSTDGGATWSTPQYLGNTVCTNTTDANSYLNAWQPTVTSLSNGTLVVAFVEFNLSLPSGCSSSAFPQVNGTCYLPFPQIFERDTGQFASPIFGNDPFPTATSDYNSSQLVVSFSYDNGTSWTAPSPVNTSTVGSPDCNVFSFNLGPLGCQTWANWIQQRPSITAFGQTIYLTWTNITGGWSQYAPTPIDELYCSFGYAVVCPSGESAVQLAVSQNGTANFSTPRQLPVLVAPGSPLWVGANPSALVTPNGTLVVAYTSNVSINSTLPTISGCPSVACGGFLSNVIVAQSADNGTTWTLGVAAGSVFDSRDYQNYEDSQDVINAGDQIAPAPKATYDSATQQLVVAFTADHTIQNYCLPVYLEVESGAPCQAYSTPDVYVANGSLANNTWTSRLVASWSELANSTPNGVLDSYFYNPAVISSSNGAIYLTAQFFNGSACTTLPQNSFIGWDTILYPQSPGPLVYCGEGLEVYGTSEDNGAAFTAPLAVDPNGTWYSSMSPGLQASMISAGNEVWVAWTQTTCPGWNGPGVPQCMQSWDYSRPRYSPTWTGFTSTTSVVVSQLFLGPGLTATFEETGLPAGATWSVNSSGYARTGVAGTALTISGILPGMNLTWVASNVSWGTGVRYYGTPNVTSPGNFATSPTILWTYVLQYALTISSNPPYPSGSQPQTWFGGEPYCLGAGTLPEFAFDPVGGMCYTATSINYNLTVAPGTTWEDAGNVTRIQAIPLNGSEFWCEYGFGCESGFDPFDQGYSTTGTYESYLNLTFELWSGAGSGSFTGTANDTTVTMDGPVNETATFGFNGYCLWTADTGVRWASTCSPNGYPLEFHETGLPSGVSWGVSVQSSLAGNATPYAAFTNQSDLVVVSPTLNVSSLAYFEPFTVPASTSGEVWVASPDPSSPLLAPGESSSTFQYSLRPVGFTDFTSTVEAVGLPNGTTWSLSVDGDGTGFAGTLGNLSLRGGNHSLEADPVYLSNGTGYVADAIDVDPFVMNETWTNVSGPSASYMFQGSAQILVQYTPIYELTALASTGGTVDVPATSWVTPGSPVSLLAVANPGYHFVSWTGTGGSSITSTDPSVRLVLAGPVGEFATFAPNASAAYVVTVSASGLTLGDTYSVEFNGTTYSGNGSFVLPAYPGGNYSISPVVVYDNASSLIRFLPVSFTTTLSSAPGGLFNLDTGGALINITFVPQYALQVNQAGSGTITPGIGEYWETAGNQTIWTATPSPGNAFLGWSGTGSGSVNSNASTISVTSGSAISEAANFVPTLPSAPSTFILTVTEVGLPGGTEWSVSAVTFGVATSGDSATVTGLNGSYVVTVPTVQVGPGVQYTSNLTSRSVVVTSNKTLRVGFSEEFELTVVAGAGGSVAPDTEWLAPGMGVTLSATPTGGYHFVGWRGQGPGNYTGSATSGMVSVGGAITETAQFAPNPGLPDTMAAGGSAVPAYAPWLGLVALLAVGFLTVYLIGLRRAEKTPTPPPHLAGKEGAPVEGSDADTTRPSPEPPRKGGVK
ncbi:MAG: hypothetical protein L3K03_07405 [Thermoplasmata archaeon]|nr:hypothetical protein [Thermoplasmata archaeon]